MAQRFGNNLKAIKVDVAAACKRGVTKGEGRSCGGVPSSLAGADRQGVRTVTAIECCKAKTRRTQYVHTTYLFH